MQRSILAFAITAAIVATAAEPVSTDQRPSSSVRPTTAKRTIQLAPSLVQKELQRNLVLAEGLRGRLPAGTDLYAAAGGFRRLELFVATVHASNNIEIPFSELKRRIVNDGMTLGQAIQDMRPKSRYWQEAHRAEDEAAAMIRTSEAVAWNR
jgi:hypothetical protein